MARLNRIVVSQQPHHVIQKAIDGQIIFKDDQDHNIFLNWLKSAAHQFKILIHAYVLMPTHYHLLLTPQDQNGLSKMMQWIGRYYVPYFNHKYKRSGTLWQGRFKANLLEAPAYLIQCIQYIESNPVRAALVKDAYEYLWSSYRHHIGDKENPLITDHPMYWSLGNTPFAREAAYKKLFAEELTPEQLHVITQAVLKGWALGSHEFKAQIEHQINQRVQPAQRGRPRSLRSTT